MRKKLFLLLMLVALSFSASTAHAAENLSIQKALLVEKVADFGQYTPKTDARYTLDEACKVYLEVAGFATPLVLNTADDYKVDLAVDVKAKLPQSGRKIGFQSAIAKLDAIVHSKLAAHFFVVQLQFGDWKPGTYVLEFGVRDMLGGQTVSQDVTIQLAEPTEADIKARQEKEAQEAQQETDPQAQPKP